MADPGGFGTRARRLVTARMKHYGYTDENAKRGDPFFLAYRADKIDATEWVMWLLEELEGME